MGNNRNDYFRYFLGVRVRLIEGVRLIKVSFKVNKGNKSGTSATLRLIEGVRLIRCPLKRVWMGVHKCQLSVKVLAICQLSVKC